METTHTNNERTEIICPQTPNYAKNAQIGLEKHDEVENMTTRGQRAPDPKAQVMNNKWTTV